MKKIRFIAYLCLLTSVTACSQNLNESDFVELSLKSGRFFESNFLSNIRYVNDFQDKRNDRKGIVPFHSGYHLSSRIRFGHNITKNIHLIGEFGLSYLTEEAVCFCHDCDKTISSFTFLRLGSSHVGLGGRYQLFTGLKWGVSLESMMYFAKLFNETKALYSGYSISPVMSYTRRNGSYLQYKMGYDQSFNKYHKKEIFVEFGYTIPIEIKRKENGSIEKSF